MSNSDRIGRLIARQLFEGRGNPSKVKLREAAQADAEAAIDQDTRQYGCGRVRRPVKP